MKGTATFFRLDLVHSGSEFDTSMATEQHRGRRKEQRQFGIHMYVDHLRNGRGPIHTPDGTLVDEDHLRMYSGVGDSARCMAIPSWADRA